jgi:hypothetical protein
MDKGRRHLAFQYHGYRLGNNQGLFPVPEIRRQLADRQQVNHQGKQQPSRQGKLEVLSARHKVHRLSWKDHQHMKTSDQQNHQTVPFPSAVPYASAYNMFFVSSTQGAVPCPK